MLKATITAAGLILAATCAHASAMTGQEFLQAWNAKGEQGIAAAYYVRGVADGSQDSAHCAPQQVTSGQVGEMVFDWLKANPKFWHRPVGYVVVAVMAVEWPCEKKPAQGKRQSL